MWPDRCPCARSQLRLCPPADATPLSHRGLAANDTPTVAFGWLGGLWGLTPTAPPLRSVPLLLLLVHCASTPQHKVTLTVVPALTASGCQIGPLLLPPMPPHPFPFPLLLPPPLVLLLLEFQSYFRRACGWPCLAALKNRPCVCMCVYVCVCERRGHTCTHEGAYAGACVSTRM